MLQGRDAVAPWPGCDPAAAASLLDAGLPRSEQAADQLGSPPEPLLLSGLCRGGKVGLGLLQHPRQRDRERDEGSVEIAGGHRRVSNAVACQAIASGRLAAGVDNVA